MAFVNTAVTDADIDRFNLPFKKGNLRHWTYDAIGQRYLWGGLREQPHIDDYRVGVFRYFDGKRLYEIRLEPGDELTSPEKDLFTREWKRILQIDPAPDGALQKESLIADLREALMVYGYDGLDDHDKYRTVVRLGF